MTPDLAVIFDAIADKAQTALNLLNQRFGREAAIARIDEIRRIASVQAAKAKDQQTKSLPA